MSKAKRIKAKATHERLRLRKEQELVERAQMQEEDIEDELPIEADLDGAENESEILLSKDYDEWGMPIPGPTSFEELEDQRQAEEKAREVRLVTYDVQDLVRNILYHPMIDPQEKSSKIQKVASDFESRVSEALTDDLQKDMDVLQIEAILAIDSRSTGIVQKAVDLVKETLSGAARKKLSGSDFALPDKKKYPIHDKAHVRNALARAAQQIKAGGEGAADAKAALPKIRTAARKFGVDVTLEKNAIIIEKDAKGDWRWIGRPTNNFIDWQKDIVSKSAHENYLAWLDANPDMAPVFLTWHTPGTARAHPVDFWMEKDGAVIMSGILTETEAAALLKAQKETDLGMSFQGVGLRLDSDDARVVTHYWMYEVSDLPLDRAANPFTTLETMTKEVGMDKLQYLTTIMGSEEKAKTYLEKTGQVQKDLQAAGITSKEKDEEQKAEGGTQQPEAKAPESLDFTVIFEKVAKELDIDGLNAFVAQAQEDHEKVGVLEGVVKELRAGFDDKLAEVLTPPAARYAWSQANRPSASDTTKLKKGSEATEDEKLSKAAPGVPDGYWLSEISGIAPVQAQQ